MKIHLEIREEYPEPEILIRAAALTPEIEKILQLLGQPSGNKTLNGYRQDTVTPLIPEKILRLYGENQKVFAQTMEGTYQLRERLYELEAWLGSEAFLRISHSEIVNRRRICRLDVHRRREDRRGGRLYRGGSGGAAAGAAACAGRRHPPFHPDGHHQLRRCRRRV